MKPRSVVGWIVLAAVLGYLFVPVTLKLNKLRRQSTDLESEIQRLASRNQVLENELRLLRSDPVYIEYTARKTFNKTKEGEVIYKLVEPSDDTDAQTAR